MWEFYLGCVRPAFASGPLRSPGIRLRPTAFARDLENSVRLYIKAMEPLLADASQILEKQDYILKSLQEYYASHENVALIVDIIQGKSVSLRVIDWFVTNYAKKNNTSYEYNHRQFFVYLDYKNQLRAYTKKQFDPFCRRDRITFTFKTVDLTVDTTVGQLNFFRWAHNYGVLDYAVEHREEIEEDMNTSLKPIYTAPTAPIPGAPTEAAPPRGTRKKRHELSQAATKSVTRQDCRIIVDFS